MKEVIIYVDGACTTQTGVGGWGAILRYGFYHRELIGGQENTTSNKMEMMAVIQSLKSLREPCRVTIYSDSKYVIDGITKWIKGWKSNGWRTKNNKPVSNADLWKEMDELVSVHNVIFKWVKGHSGDPGNTRADSLAVSAKQMVKTRGDFRQRKKLWNGERYITTTYPRGIQN